MKKNLKKYNDFINESLRYPIVGEIPERDDNYKFLMNITEKARYEDTMHFYVKNLIEIGTINNHKLYLNYLDKNTYEDRLSYWFVYNEQLDKLTGTKWDIGVIWEEDEYLVHSEENNLDIKLYPDFIEIITKEIKSYDNLEGWIDHIKNVGINRRKFQRQAIQSYHGDKNKKLELTWEERLERIKNTIESDKLIDRHKEPYAKKTLDKMLELGEEEFTKQEEEETKIINDIIDDMRKKGEL